MFKNSKFLKGVFLALAVVLVLGGGVMLKLYANAEANTVVYYVSDKGNNTTGQDAATAFNSFEAAVDKAAEIGMAPGTELKLIVVDQVYIESRYLDGSTLKDTAGNKVPITITSEKTGSQEEFATILQHAYNTSGSTSYEHVYISNDVTFKDIIINGEAQPYYQSNAPMTDPVDYSKLFRSRHMHAGNNNVVFDNCVITSTIPDKSKTWTFYCDAYAASSVDGVSNLTLKNGDYSNVTVYVQDQITPLWDLSFTVENASIGTVYAMADTDTSTSANAKSINVRFKDATVSSYNPMGRGNVGVTNGLTAIFEGDTVVKNWVACMSNSSSTGTYYGDLKYYFRDNCSISVTSADSQSTKIIYLTPPVMTGDLYVNVEGGTFNNVLCTGTDKNKSKADPAPQLNGNIYNEFKGGTFKAGIYCGMGVAGGTVNGSIYNNFYDGFYLEKGTSYFAGRGCDINGDVVTNWYGGTVAKVEVYFGGGNGLATTDKNVLDGDLINNFYGGTFGGNVWVGPHSQTITGALYNTFMGGTFTGTFIAGGIGIITSEVHNVFKNGPDGTHATLNGGTIVLGSRGKNSSGPDKQNIERLYNTFEGDVVVKGTLYCAGGTQSGGKQISELVQNNFKGGTFSSSVYGGPRYDKEILAAKLENNFYDGATFSATLYCGGQSGGSGAITNNFYGGFFDSYVYGASVAVSGKNYFYNVDGDITNNFYGGYFDSQVIGGGMVTSDGTIYNNFYGGYFNYFVYGGNNANGLNNMDVVNTVCGGDFNAWLCGGSSNSRTRSITNNIYGGHFIGAHKEALHSEAGRSCLYAGDYAAATSGSGQKTASVTTNIYGGIFEERVYLGGRIGTVAKVNSMIAGGIFNGDRISPSMYQDAASKNCSEVTLDIKPDESDELLFFGCHYTPYGEEGAKVYWSYGLENNKKRPKDTVVLHGAQKPIYIGGESFLNFDDILGEVTFIQTEDWVDGNVYVTVPEAKNLDNVKFFNAEEGLSGSAEIKTMKVGLDNENDSREGKTSVSCDVLVGTDSGDDLTALAMPKLAAMNFVLDNNLKVNFYVMKDALEAYLATAGTFTYRVTCGDEVLSSGSIASLDEAVVVDNKYVKIETGFEVAAFSYGQQLTLDFAGVQQLFYEGTEQEKDTISVYELLQIGIANSPNAPELAELLKAIYNYGVEAEKIQNNGTASVTDYYNDITYTGTYTGKPRANNLVAGYKFVTTNLSLGKEVSLNFMLNVATTEGLSFSAASDKVQLDASRIVVTPFAGNSRYNLVVALKLDIASMDEEFTLSVKSADGTLLATGTFSVADACANYIASNNEFAPISKALLAYVEKAQAL